MKRFNLLIIITCLFWGGIPQDAGAQIALQYTDTLLCPGQDLQMCAALTGQADPISADDTYTGVLNIGFPFIFFGKPYEKCIVSGNGQITFDTTDANQFAGWMWSQVSTGQANNSIFATFLDLYLPAGGKVRYQSFGNPGSRRFIVEWCHLPVYGCNQLEVTSQAILYETTNVIEIHTTEIMPITGNCPTASGTNNQYGQVIQGVRNDLGTFSYYPVDRDPVVSTTNWGISGIVNDGMRFTPNGSTTYLMDPIPFNPWIIIDSASSVDLKWYAEGEPNLPIATGACASVVTNGDINYYTVRFNGNAGCENELVNFIDTVHIHFGSTYDTTQVDICAGSTYSWFGNDLFKAGNYDTLLTSSIGCDSFLRLQLFVNPLPVMTIKGSTNVEICDGSSTVLSLANAQNGVTYQWYKDNYPVSGETGYQISVSQAGEYKVEGTTAKGCKETSAVFRLKVNPNPIAGIEPISNDIICAYDTLELSAITGTGDDYRWSPAKPFRIITGADGEKVKGVFIDPVTLVTMTVYNQFGCYDTASVMVATKPCCEVFIPNAFSPNGDGLNEYFNPQLQPGQILLTMQVFDRYGKLVYNNTNIKKGWDGRYEDGSEASSDVYMYFMKYTCADGKLYEQKESVSLIR